MTEEEPDRTYMGTAEEAHGALAKATSEWRAFRQPRMATAREHKRIEVLEREAGFRLCNAALLWLWHVENPL